MALLVPLALVLSQLPLYAPGQPAAVPAPTSADQPVGSLAVNPAPISLDALDSTADIGDPPLAEEDALPMPLSLTSRTEALAPLVVPATIAGDKVRLRNGPGLDYDEVKKLTGGASIQVVGRYGEWLQVREPTDKALYWVASELVDVPEAVIFTLFEVQKEAIPAPPPPKVGLVREDGLSLRDGPGTNYIKMKSLEAGQEIALIEQYHDWLYVSSGDLDGWVKAEFLNIGPNVLNRVPVADTIPDPNPPLIGTVNENAVNLRKGPGSAYAKVGSVNAGAQVDLLARHKDWFRVQLSNGTKAWVFSDLLNVTPMARRRVPYTNDIPALPRAAVVSGGRGGRGNAAGIPASGDIASFAVQFVGTRYRWGGSSPAGFDCSGLTSYVYRQFGIGLPHSARAQYSTAYGAMVGDMGNLAPGDLMFFVNTGGRRGISHVAIYIGGGRMIHAMTPSYGVQVSGVWDSYWTSHYYGAIRVRR